MAKCELSQLIFGKYSSSNGNGESNEASHGKPQYGEAVVLDCERAWKLGGRMRPVARGDKHV